MQEAARIYDRDKQTYSQFQHIDPFFQKFQNSA